MTDKIPLRSSIESEHRLQISQAINQLIDGKINSTGTVTLTTSATTTTVTNTHASVDSVIVLCPLDANAAGEYGTIYVSTRSNGSFVLTHANAGTTRQFAYAILG